MAFELNQFGIGIKTVSPGGIKTDFVKRSLDTTSHPAYAALIEKLFAVFMKIIFLQQNKLPKLFTKQPQTEKANCDM